MYTFFKQLFCDHRWELEWENQYVDAWGHIMWKRKYYYCANCGKRKQVTLD